MTRQEELIAEYESATEHKCNKAEKELLFAVLQWADAHPICPWVSIKEYLPEESKEEKEWSIEVYVRNEYGGTTAACYNYKRKEWYLTYGEIEGGSLIHTDITHWMPIPKL